MSAYRGRHTGVVVPSPLAGYSQLFPELIVCGPPLRQFVAYGRGARHRESRI